MTVAGRKKAPLVAAELAELLARGDAPACVAMLLACDEKTRRALHEQATNAVHALGAPDTPAPEVERRRDAALLARLATAPPNTLSELFWRCIPSEPHLALLGDIVVALPAGSRALERIVKQVHAQTWRLSLLFEARGLGPVPSDDDRLPAFVAALPGQKSQAPRLASALRADPSLHRFVWRMFVVPDAWKALAENDAAWSARERWDEALAELAADGTLSRARLLDAVLDAMAGDSLHAWWFVGLHQRLAPADAECGERADRYLPLLSTGFKPMRDLAVESITRMLRARRPPDHLFAGVAAALTTKQKTLARTLLGFLDEAVRQSPACAPQAAHVAAVALGHASPDVQATALEFVVTHGDRRDESLIDKLRAAREGLAPSNQPRLDELLPAPVRVEAPAPDDSAELIERARRLPQKWRVLAGVDAALHALETGTCRLPALSLEPLEVPRLAQPVVPIESVEELIDESLAAIEGARSADGLERVVDGIARLSRLRPPGFEAWAAPLRSRAVERVTQAARGSRMLPGAQPFVGEDLLLDLMVVVAAWLEGCGERKANWDGDSFRWPGLFGGQWRSSWNVPPTPGLFLSLRLHALARRVYRGECVPLLSTPTHAGGFIDPRVLVARARAVGERTDSFDRILALHRLAPEHRAEALAEAAALDGEFGAALCHALGGCEPIGPTAELWFAAARARAPLGDDEAVERTHPTGGPDAARAARYAIDRDGFPDLERGACFDGLRAPRGCLSVQPPLPGTVAPECLGLLFHAGRAAGGAPLRAWESALWPMSRASLFASQVLPLATCIDSQGSYWHGDWEALFDADAAPGIPGTLLIALGLEACHPTLARMAEDALVAGIDDGRIDGESLGAALSAVLRWKHLTLSRWTRAFGEVARLSALHCLVMRDAVERALGDAAPEPRSVFPLVELLREWSVTSGEPVAHEAARAWLAGIGGGGRLATLAKALLAVPAQNAPSHRRAAVLRALVQRVARGERWCAMAGREEVAAGMGR